MSNALKLRVLVTGAGGQLGRALLETAPPGVAVRGLARGDCDITDVGAIDAALVEPACDVLINAAAYTAVDRAEEQRDAAMAANALAPGLLAQACAARDIRFLHVSTDFVFDGRQSHPYAPSDQPAPLGAYGESKRAGEVAVQKVAGDHLILRTGWVYAAQGHNFLRTMLRLHGERDELTVVDDQVGTPTAARSLAAALWSAAQHSSLRGVYHFSDAGVCSWYDFAVAIGEEAQALGLIERAASVRPIASADYPTPARRPPYSVLDKRDTLAALSLTPVHWRQQLRETLVEIRKDIHA